MDMKVGIVVQIVMAGLACAAAAGSAIGQERFSSDTLLAFPLGDGAGCLMLPRNFGSAELRGNEIDRAVQWMPDGGLASYPQGVGKELNGCINLSVDPVIGAQRVGVINGTDAAVTFSVEQGGTNTVHALAGREIVTLELPPGSSLKASISTRDHYETAELVAGTLYEVRGNKENRWIFAKR